MTERITHKVTLIPGDGIGPEVTQAVVRILEATGVKFECWERLCRWRRGFRDSRRIYSRCAVMRRSSAIASR